MAPGLERIFLAVMTLSLMVYGVEVKKFGEPCFAYQHVERFLFSGLREINRLSGFVLRVCRLSQGFEAKLGSEILPAQMRQEFCLERSADSWSRA